MNTKPIFPSVQAAIAYFKAKKNPNSYNVTPIALEWANMLANNKWGWFITCETPYSLTLPSARRLMVRFFDHLKYIVGNGIVKLFWAAEPFDTKYGYHTHGLLNITAPPEKIIEAFQIVTAAKRKGLKAPLHMRPYNPERAAALYCAKYIQNKFSDYDMFYNKSDMDVDTNTQGGVERSETSPLGIRQRKFYGYQSLYSK